MAILNQDEGCVVLRIVYAGAPMSGKTESLRSLSGLLFGAKRAGEEFYSPDHTEGRTLYFDWLNYIGGYYRGYKVNCQLISVPGQKTLKNRRKLLLEMADVVVFVVDSEAGKLESALSYYQEMQPWLERGDEPPVGIVIQANKRDSETAIPIADIYQAFQDNPNLLVLETIAIKNTGIREAFVSGVRIGLERATWLIENDKMAKGVPDLASGDMLLNLIQSQEAAELSELGQAFEDGFEAPRKGVREVQEVELSATHLHDLITQDIRSKPAAGSVVDISSAGSLAWQGEEPVGVEVKEMIDSASTGSAQTASLIQGLLPESLTQADPIPANGPKLPNKDVIAGSVYPPITGRIILHKLAGMSADVEQGQDGNWLATIGDQWRLLSRAEDRFINQNEARMKLLHYANAHKKLGNRVSEHRCLTIVESDGGGEWRVWQIIRNESTLGELLSHALMGNYPYKIAEEIYKIAENFVEAHKIFANADHGLPLHFDTIAINKDKPVYTGFIHDQSSDNTSAPLLESVKSNFHPHIAHALHDNPILSLGVPYVLSPLEGFGRLSAEMRPVVDVLRRLLIGEH